ncbi:MAG TPA: signal peptidase II [Solirubrobacteraceae bacterium]|nr:signal peptidase II [Solirubrobacteraceae bacterium]
MSSVPRPRRRLALVVAAAVVAVDAITKAIAANALAGRGRVAVLDGHLHLLLYRNHAGPGNSFAGHPVLVSLLSLGAVLAIAALVTRVRARSTAVALGLLLGGGVGNLIDRLVTAPGPLRGGVIDWLQASAHGGSMNLADLSINAAVAVLIVGGAIEWWLAGRPRTPEPSEAASR